MKGSHRIHAWGAALLASAGLGAGCMGGIQQEGGLCVRERSIERHGDGTLRAALLAVPAEIDGIPCRGWARFHANGRLEESDLARDFTISGQPIPEGSRVAFRENGDFWSTFLARDTLLDGIPCDGGPLKCQTTFHPNGRVKLTFLYEDALIQGVPCESSVFAGVHFDAEGKLIGCRLSRDATVGGVRFPAGARLSWGADGTVAAH